jgi:hypothetical protein
MLLRNNSINRHNRRAWLDDGWRQPILKRILWGTILGLSIRTCLFFLLIWNQYTTTLEDDKIALQNKSSCHRIIFLHVGKTGGSTVKTALRIKCTANKWQPEQRSACQSQMNTFFMKNGGENAISKHVIGYSHVNVQPTDKVWRSANVFLFSIRSPIVRFISWYDSVMERMCLETTTNNSCITSDKRDHEGIGNGILECFPNNIDSLARNLTLIPSRPEYNLCWKRAWQIFKLSPSRVLPSWMWHIHPYNYHYYTSQSLSRYPQNQVFAIRTENLWTDFSQIDSSLGGNGSGYRRIQINRGKRIFPLSREGRQNLCCALWDEILHFEEILRRAVNVNPTAYMASMKKVFRDCGQPMPHVKSSSTGNHSTWLLQTWSLLANQCDMVIPRSRITSSHFLQSQQSPG